MIRTYRDIQLIDKDAETYLAIACDVSAAIGPKENDLIRVSNDIAGYYATAVTFIELLAIGAKPISVIDTLGCEMSPSGKEIISGIQRAMVEAGIPRECLTGSTEDNMPTTTTSIGITVVSEMPKVLLERYQPKKNHYVYLIGKPKMGQVFLEEEILGHKGEVIDIDLVKKIRSNSSIGHILPVGSKGVGYELGVLLSMNHLELRKNDLTCIDMVGSAGPATCMLVCCEQKEGKLLQEILKIEVVELGQLV